MIKLDTYDKMECLRLAKDIAIASGLIKNSNPEEYILASAKKFEEFIILVEPVVEPPAEIIEEKFEEKEVEWIESDIV